MAVEGACWYDRNVEGLPAPTGDDQYVRFGEPSLHRFIRWVGELFSVKTPELRRQTIVAAMYGTWVKNEREARKFWTEVARGGEEFTENAPSTVLDGWLKAMVEKRGGKNELKPAIVRGRRSRPSNLTPGRVSTTSTNSVSKTRSATGGFGGFPAETLHLHPLLRSEQLVKLAQNGVALGRLSPGIGALPGELKDLCHVEPRGMTQAPAHVPSREVSIAAICRSRSGSIRRSCAIRRNSAETTLGARILSWAAAPL